jgi:outer membrane protein TolC
MKQLFSLLLLLMLQTGFSQENQYSFTLDEAISFALENNRQAKNAQRDIEAAKKQKWETIATGLPQINANIDFQNFLQQPVQLVPAEFFGGNEGEFEEVVFGTQQNMVGLATLTQKIFDGSYIVGLQSAKVYLQISENAKIKTDWQVRQNVINAYGNVLLTEESVEILENNKAILEKNLNETKAIYTNGMAEEESVEQLQITLSSIESSLKNIKRLSVLAYKMFNITVGLDISAEVTLTDDLETLTTENIDLAILESDENPENTIDYKIAFNDLTSKELLVKLEKSKALPTLNGFINGGYSGFSESFTFLDREQDWFGSSLIGISLNIPIISSGMRSASTQRAKINLEKAKEDLKEVEQQTKFQIQTAKSNYQFAIEDYDIKKQNLNLAERIEQKNQTKFFEGIASSFDLRQAQTQLYTAQQEYLQAMLDLITKKAELETILNKTN